MRRLFALVIVCLSVGTAGCVQYVVPTGAAPLRYRDDIFTGVTKTADITYGSAVNASGVTQSLELDMYRPTGDTVTSRPAIVWVHGGSFSGGTKTSGEIVSEANAFAKKGFVNVSIEYRLRGGCSASNPAPCVAAIADAQHDAQAAVRFLRANAATYGIDVNRIAAGGTSAGAITAMQVAYNANSPGDSGNPGYPSNIRAAVSLSGALILGGIEAGEPPSLDFHGTEDALVPYAWATRTVEWGAAAGVPVYLTTYQGEGHVPIAPAGRFQSIIDQSRNFLYSTMDLAHAAR